MKVLRSDRTDSTFIQHLLYALLCRGLVSTFLSSFDNSPVKKPVIVPTSQAVSTGQDSCSIPLSALPRWKENHDSTEKLL